MDVPACHSRLKQKVSSCTTRCAPLCQAWDGCRIRTGPHLDQLCIGHLFPILNTARARYTQSFLSRVRACHGPRLYRTAPLPVVFRGQNQKISIFAFAPARARCSTQPPLRDSHAFLSLQLRLPAMGILKRYSKALEYQYRVKTVALVF
jgi:hypothetical protein